MVLSNAEFAKLANEGGASRSLKTSQPAEGPGVMVSKPSAENITPAPLTEAQVSAFKKKHAANATE